MTEIADFTFSYDALSETAEFIKSKVSIQPLVLIICGSGLGTLAETLENAQTINYSEIPNFPVSTVQGHAGKFVFGTISNVPVVCMQGRFHYYEGYSLQKCTTPIRVMYLLGVKILFVTNAAGGVNRNYKLGDIMFIKDHVNLLGFAGVHPLRGPNDPKFGERFYPVNKAYDKELIKTAFKIANEIGLGQCVHEGVYAMLGGPNYETIAEYNALETMGVDAVGMSTVAEVLVAKHCGMKVFGFSLISDEGIHSYDDDSEPNHLEVLAAVNKRAEDLKTLIIKIVGSLGTTQICECQKK